VASAKQPMEYRRFISRLRFLEVCIPWVGETGSPFMVFRWGGSQGSYGAIPNGLTHVLINHDSDFLVPVAEVDNCLRHLDPEGSLATAFWAIEDHSEDKRNSVAEDQVNSSGGGK